MSKEKARPLFFLALLPTDDIQQQVTEIKLEFAERYQCRHALKSPPHITLFPPFRGSDSLVESLNCLKDFCGTRVPFSVILDGFGAFAPRVIYVNPLSTPELLDTHLQLHAFLKARLSLVDKMATKRAFFPHLTVANRDLTVEQFWEAWSEFEGRSLKLSFIATRLTLLRHQGSRWEIDREWAFEG